MDYTSKEAKKLLRDYYKWWWEDLHMETLKSINNSNWYDRPYVLHEKVDHSLDIRRGLEKGILTPPCDRDHDEAISELMEIWKTIDLTDLVNGFLYSLSTCSNQYRTAIASYFFAKGMTAHKGKHVPGYDSPERCAYCGMPFNEEGKTHIDGNLLRYILYSPQKYTIEWIQNADYALFDLKQFKELPKVKYKQEDVDILVKILKLAETLGKDNKYTALQKLITRGKILDATGNETIVILGVLSVCGIFQTNEHRGYTHKFTSCDNRHFEGYETELFYPLYFWKGKDGVDMKALAEVFPACVTEAMEADKAEVSLTDVYSESKKDSAPVSRAEDAFTDGKHILELDDRRRHYFGLSRLDPTWHKEVRYSVLYNSFKRTEVYFEGNSIKKVIFESKDLQGDGTLSDGTYSERDIVAETEDRYLLLPKTSRGRKKPWTPSLLDTFTYVTVRLEVNFGVGMHLINWKNGKTLPLVDQYIGNGKSIKSPLAFYTYTDEYIRNIPENYEEVLADFRGD